jgi:hypothetical protein
MNNHQALIWRWESVCCNAMYSEALECWLSKQQAATTVNLLLVHSIDQDIASTTCRHTQTITEVKKQHACIWYLQSDPPARRMDEHPTLIGHSAVMSVAMGPRQKVAAEASTDPSITNPKCRADAA